MEADSVVQVWFGDDSERELAPDEMYLAVYAAGGGKRNMANFTRSTDGKFRPSDVHVYLTSDLPENEVAQKSQLYICRFASGRMEWVLKPVPGWRGHPQLKLVPEWFKARFWDNKQEKKHPWFMFALVCETASGQPRLCTSNAFPVHQYYPTGVKKTDPNESACHDAFHRVLKLAPSTELRRELLGRRRPADAVDAVYPARARLNHPRDPPAFPQGYRDGRSQFHELPTSPMSSGSQSPTSPPMTPVSDYGQADSRSMDCDADGTYVQPGFVTPRQRTASRGYFYPDDVGEPLKNIGKSGIDAAQALLALRSSPVGFQYRDSPMR